MYKDNNHIDLELVVEVGSIAHKLRALEKTHQHIQQLHNQHYKYLHIPHHHTISLGSSTCSSIYNAQTSGTSTGHHQQQQLTSTGTTTGTGSHQSTILNSNSFLNQQATSTHHLDVLSVPNSHYHINQLTISNGINEPTLSFYTPTSDFNPYESTDIKRLEDLIIKIYEKHKDRYCNMNYSANRNISDFRQTTNNSGKSTIHKCGIIEEPSDITSSTNTIRCIASTRSKSLTTSGDNTPLIKLSPVTQNRHPSYPEIQVVTEAAGGLTETTRILSGSSDDEFESTLALDQIDELNTIINSDGNGNGGSGIENVNYEDIKDEDFRAIVKDLKRKIEHTERMNWLCISKRPAGAPVRKTSLPKHSTVKQQFLDICDSKFSDEVKAALRLPAFDSYEWEDAEVLHLMQTMFIEMGLVEKFNIPLSVLRDWLYEVYKHYNEVPFHNFRHCFCVAQMMFAIAWHTNLGTRLGDLEVLILLVSCICHDLDHPGYNNIYQINARTELALRYNDISPLENHHCSIAFRLLEHPDCNIFKNFNKEQFKEIREGIIRCILATDMARHNEILTQFKEVIQIFDYENRSHTNLLCMVLIKVADISNEARPMDVAEPWLDRLLQEFFAQSAAEKSEGLPVTPFMDPDKVSKPGSQVRFIGLVLLPLFEALGELLTELNDLIINPVRVALDYYKRLNDMQSRSRKSLVETENSSEGGSPQLPRSQSGISVRSRRSIPSQKSASRNSVDEPLCLAAELQDLPEGSESGDSETATEVEVAEKTSKFKVDTESNNRKSSNISHLKKGTSRDKRPSMISEMCNSGAGRMRGSYGNIHNSNRSNFGSNRAVSLDQYSTNSRRMSDVLQAVNSDNSVFYNRKHLSMDHDPLHQSNEKTHIDHKEMTVGRCNEPSCMNRVITNPDKSSSINSSTTSGPKSFMTRLKQLTGRLALGLDKDNKRSNSIKNNNGDKIKNRGFCCNIADKNEHGNLTKCTEFIKTATNYPMTDSVQDTIMPRNRAYSLDVPTARTRRSSSSGGDSRKSSRNDDSSHVADNSSSHSMAGVSELEKRGSDSSKTVSHDNNGGLTEIPQDNSI